MPSTILPMSTMKWREAADVIAGVVGLGGTPGAQQTAKQMLKETLQDWDTRADWRYTQVVAPDNTVTPQTDSVDLPTPFKKPYVAYLVANKTPLWYIERGNWHRMFPGEVTRTIPRFYTLFNENDTGQANLFPLCGISDTLVLLYYRPIQTAYGDDDYLDIPDRWEGYILSGARARMADMKGVGVKSDKWTARYEQGIRLAKEDDRRNPDQFLSFQPPSEFNMPPYFNPNSTWESVVGA